MSNITIDDFLKIDIRVGKIIEVQAFPEARKPAWKLVIDFGADIGIKRSSAQIVDFYTAQDLIDCQILCVVNLPPRQIGHFFSEVLTLGVSDAEGRVILISPEQSVPLGTRLF